MIKTVKAMVIVFFFIFFPFISNYLLKLGFVSLELLVFAGLSLWRGFKADTMLFRACSLVLAALLLAGAFFANSYLVWLIPSIAYLWLTVLFGYTLVKPPSLCERLVRLIYPDFLPGVGEYLFELTLVWTLFFAVNVIVCALLPVVFGQTVWAVYTGIVVYLLMGLLAVAEWFYRHRRFPDMAIPPANETLKYLSQHGHEAFKSIWS